MLSLEASFLENVKEDEKIIHKVISLYVDHPEDRRDLYQEILLQAWKSYRNFKGKSKFSTWLYKVSLNTVLSFKKKVVKVEGLDSIGLEKLIGESKKENHEILYYLIKQLNEIDRMLMTLHLDGYSNQEIAEITGASSNNVGVKIHRLKSKIVDQFKKYSNGYS